MNKKVSNKIVYLNFILAFLILNLHSAYTQKSFGSTAGRIVRAWHGVRYCWH